jgi:hypothetical protein
VSDGPDKDATPRLDIGAYELQGVFFPTRFEVSTAVDENDLDFTAGDLSLREAVGLCNCAGVPENVVFASSMAGQPVLLTQGPIRITGDVAIFGLGASLTTINGQNNTRLFEIASSARGAFFAGLTLTGGKTTAFNDPGGAIRSDSTETLRIRDSVISNNSTTGQFSSGGAIRSLGPVEVIRSTIAGNVTAGQGANGGGISAGVVSITDSTISGNSVEQGGSGGGGVYAESSAVIINSTISGNHAQGFFAAGGGISSQQSLTLVNSTVTDNSVTGSLADGGGVASAGTTTIRNSIIAGNLDNQNGSNPDLFLSGSVSVQHSLIGNRVGSNLAEANPGPDASGNKIGGPTGGLLNPQLGPLADNRGFTKTHALLTGSPALNAGNSTLIAADTLDLDGDGNTTEPLPHDQRGRPFKRVTDTTVDMGAVELQTLYAWHNFQRGLDVVGSGTATPDGRVVAADALAVINYINAFGSGAVPTAAAFGQPYGYLDTTGGEDGGGDDFVAPNDALAVINFINAFGAGLSGPAGEGEGNTQDVELARTMADLFALLADDVAIHNKRRRSS